MVGGHFAVTVEAATLPGYRLPSNPASKKTDDPNRRACIVTEPGVGYRMARPGDAQ